jgi:hypothetical protein
MFNVQDHLPLCGLSQLAPFIHKRRGSEIPERSVARGCPSQRKEGDVVLLLPALPYEGVEFL